MKSVSVPLRRGAVVATALLGLALAGCSRAEPGVVAYVGDTAITQTQVDRAVAGVSSTVEEGQAVLPQAVVNALVAGELSAQIAADRTITITDADRDKILQGTNLASLVNVPDARQVAYDLADQALVSQQLGEQGYLAEVGKRDVTLNPRFGVLDPATKMINPDQSGSLSVPAGAPAGTP
jgi:hypothetical protein